MMGVVLFSPRYLGSVEAWLWLCARSNGRVGGVVELNEAQCRYAWDKGYMNTAQAVARVLARQVEPACRRYGVRFEDLDKRRLDILVMAVVCGAWGGEDVKVRLRELCMDAKGGFNVTG